MRGGATGTRCCAWHSKGPPCAAAAPAFAAGGAVFQGKRARMGAVDVAGWTAPVGCDAIAVGQGPVQLQGARLFDFCSKERRLALHVKNNLCPVAYVGQRCGPPTATVSHGCGPGMRDLRATRHTPQARQSSHPALTLASAAGPSELGRAGPGSRPKTSRTPEAISRALDALTGKH